MQESQAADRPEVQSEMVEDETQIDGYYGDDQELDDEEWNLDFLDEKDEPEAGHVDKAKG